MSGSANSGGDVLKSLRAATKGLTFPSESDKPVKVLFWHISTDDKSEAVSEAAIRAGASLGPNAKVEAFAPKDFFAPVVKEETWFGPDEKARSKQFRDVAALLDTLAGTTAFRVTGASSDASRVDAYVVGRTSDGALAGIQTQLVET